jgi:hypothetical protein
MEYQYLICLKSISSNDRITIFIVSTDQKFLIYGALYSSLYPVQNVDYTDEPPRWVLMAMRCLTRWPFENHVITLPVTYPGFERDVFTNVCHYFAQESSPLLSEEVALGLLGLIRWCQLLDVDQSAHLDDMLNSASSSLRRSSKTLHSPGLSSEGIFLPSIFSSITLILFDRQ